MNEYDVPGDVVSAGSGVTQEFTDKQLDVMREVYARFTDPDEAWQELQKQRFPDITESSKYTVTLRMDSEYTAFKELTGGRSPDVSPPDTLTATWNSDSVDIPVTFWSLSDGSGLGFWLDTDGTRSWHVLRSKSWQAKVIDNTQLELPWLLEGEIEHDDEGRIISADLRAVEKNPPTVPVNVHLTGDREPGAPFDLESGIILFSTDTLQRILNRNRLKKFIAPPSVSDGTEYTDLGEDYSAHMIVEAGSKQIATPADERGDYIQIAGKRFSVSIQKMDFHNQSSLPLDEIGLHSDPRALRIFSATVLELINSDANMGKYSLDYLCAFLSQDEWKRANAAERQKIRTDTLRTLIVGSWTSVGTGNDLAALLNIQFIHRNDQGDVDALTIAVPPWLQQVVTERRGRGRQLESEYSKRHRSEGTLRSVGYLPTGNLGYYSYAIGIAEWMSLHEAVSRGAERTFIRQQLLTEFNAVPTLKKMLSDKTHKIRIVEYYCKALYSLLSVPKGAELNQILPYGDAAIVREHKTPYMTLKAWTDYESLSGTNKVEQWLKQKGVLHPASDERSALADDLRKRVEIRAKIGKQSAERARRAQEKKANGKR